MDAKDDIGENFGHQKDMLFFPRHVFEQHLIGSNSEPNSRAGSIKRPTNVSAFIAGERRRNSLPMSTEKTLSNSYDDITDHGRHSRRVRSFKTTSKGIATATLRSRRELNMSDTSPTDLNKRRSSGTSDDNSVCCKCSPSCSAGYFRVCLIGADAVGKRTLINQFMSAERMGSKTYESEEVDDTMLSVVIDNEESTIEFVEFTEIEEDRFPVDAYIVVFSVHERETYDVAMYYLQFIRNEKYSDRPIIIVANKVDLVRKRQVTNDEAKHLATRFNCKYIETSATLNLKVNELLVGVLKQIKLQLNPEMTPEHHDACFKGPKELLSKLFHLKVKHRCDDVLAL